MMTFIEIENWRVSREFINQPQVVLKLSKQSTHISMALSFR